MQPESALRGGRLRPGRHCGRPNLRHPIQGRSSLPGQLAFEFADVEMRRLISTLDGFHAQRIAFVARPVAVA